MSAAGLLEGVLVALRPAASTSFYGHDQQGSTRMLTDPRGHVTATFTYSPYGQTVSHTGAADTPLRYDGQYLDTETGCYYLQARYYNPAIAQFLTRDPPFLPLAADVRNPDAMPPPASLDGRDVRVNWFKAAGAIDLAAAGGRIY